MKEAESAAALSTIAMPSDLARGGFAGLEKPSEHLRWWAAAAAILLHLSLIAALLWDWHLALPMEPDPIKVRVVFAPPPPPPPAEVVQQPPPPPPVKYAESGKDQRTTAPRPAEETAPEAAAPPEAAPEPTTPEQPAQPAVKPAAKPAPPQESAKPKPRKEVARLEAPKEATAPRAPRTAPKRPIDIEPGERRESGDPYLNLLRDTIERHWFAPDAVGQFGLPVEGVAVYRILIDRAGNLKGIALDHSSGAAVLDQAGETIIRNATPFPPVPPEFPGQTLMLVLKLPLYSSAH